MLTAGDAIGDVNEMVLRQIQIREAVTAHFEKEQQLFAQGIKVLTLFFIDEVAKYRVYDGNVEKQGEYARIFEEEYTARLNEVLTLEDSRTTGTCVASRRRGRMTAISPSTRRASASSIRRRVHAPLSRTM